MILVWDTCALNALCRAIAEYTKRTAPLGEAPASRGAAFLSTLGAVMHELQSRCECSNLTSDVVFDGEIDPTAPHSRLRNQHELLECFCEQGSFVADWLSSLETRIGAVAIHEQEIEQLRPSIQPDPGRHDISLIVAALKISNQQNQDCIVVTDDADLLDRVKELRRHREVFLGAQQYSTGRIAPKLSLEILQDLYIRCGTDHEFWKEAMFSFASDYPGPPERRHHKKVVAYFGSFENDRREKQRLNSNAEFNQVFGVENG
jgi:hypothetical protein